MRTLAHVTLLATSLVLLGLLPVPRPSAPPAAKCVAAKMLAAGKAARVRLAFIAKATVAGTNEDAGCHGRADGRLTAAVERAESRGGCLTTGDAPRVAAAVEACVSGLRGALRPQPEASVCTGAKLKTSGATVLAKMRCQRTGVLRGAAPIASCLVKRDGILDARFAKLDPGPSCLTVGDAVQARALIDQCVADVMGPLPATTTTSLVPVPTTTTTLGGATTTSSTSTSTSSTSTSSSSTSTSNTSTSTSSSVPSTSSSTSISSTSTSRTSTSSSSTSTSSTSTSTSSSVPSTSSSTSSSTTSTSRTSTSSSTTSTSTSSTTSSSAYTCGGIFPLCAGTCPPLQNCGGLFCTCQ